MRKLCFSCPNRMSIERIWRPKLGESEPRFPGHPGGMPGARADLARFVDDDSTIIVLMNLDDVDINAIVRGVATLYLPARVPSDSR